MIQDRTKSALPFALLVAFVASPVPFASGETKPQASTAATPSPVSTEPQTTSAAYGDWVLRCQRVGDAATAQRICDVEQAMQVQGQQAPVAAIAVGRAAAKEPQHVTVQLPTSVTFPSSVKLTTDDKDTQPIEAAWLRCLPAGCFATTEIKEDDLKRWRAQTGNGRIQFKDGMGRELTLPFSFRGFAQAMDGLTKTAP